MKTIIFRDESGNVEHCCVLGAGVTIYPSLQFAGLVKIDHGGKQIGTTTLSKLEEVIEFLSDDRSILELPMISMATAPL